MDPNWNHLPRQPRLFFELPENATPRDLKRAYGRLIKQFKPDSHPTEFMRIRAAYENLDRAMAYGMEDSDAAPLPITLSPTDQRPAPISIPPPPSARPVDPVLSLRNPPPASVPPAPQTAPREPTFAERLLELGSSGRGELPPDLKPSSPADYIHLAFFREALASEAEGPAIFFKTLLEGAQKFRGDMSIAQALRLFFAGLTEGDEIVRCLEQARWALTPGTYFYVTEGAWFRLSEVAGGSVAAEKLKEFTADTPANAGKITFLVRFLRHHYDTVDVRWFEDCLLEIQEHGSLAQEGDLAFLTALLDYIRLPRKLAETYPFLIEVRSVVQAVCRDEAANHLARIYRFYRKLGDLANTCQHCSGPLSELLPVYQVLECVMLEQSGIFNEPDPERQRTGAHPDTLKKLIHELDLKIAAAWPAEKPSPSASWIGYLSLFVGIVAALKVGKWMHGAPTGACIMVGMAAGIGAFFASARWVFGPALMEPPPDRHDAFWEIYETVVRPRVAAYLKAHQLTLTEFIATTGSRPDVRQLYERSDFFRLVACDMPLAFHSLGMRLTVN